MLKITHEKIVTLLYDEMPSYIKDMLSFKDLVKGSTFPDRYLPYRIMIHDYKGSLPLVMSMIHDITANPQTPAELSKKLGIVSHFLIDSTTAYHANPAYKNRHLEHHAYEVSIEKQWTHFKNEGGPVISSLETFNRDVEAYLGQCQTKGVMADPMRDLSHAVSMTRSLFDILIRAVMEAVDARKRTDHSLPRVALVSDTYFPHVNGVSNTVHETVRHFQKTGQPYVLVIPRYRKPAWPLMSGMNIHTFKSIRFPVYPQMVLPVPGRRGIARVLDAFKPDVIHVMTEFSLGSRAVSYGRKRGIPVITNYSTYFHLGMKHMKIGLLTRPLNAYLSWFHRRGDRVTCPSVVTKEHLENQGLGRVSVFSRGVDTSRFSANHRSIPMRASWNATDKTVFLYVGRVSGEKDVDIACKAWNTMPDEDKARTRLVVAGDGPLLKTLQTQYPDVIFTGMVRGSALLETYASADVFVFPSPSETFGNVVLEAMASGLPAIVSDKGGVLSTVRHGENGLVTPEKDIQAFQTNMRLLVSSEMTLPMRRQALLTARSRTWEGVIVDLNRIYRNVLSERSTPIESFDAVAQADMRGSRSAI
jgi:glycosyltransferase involved in cell wall biosynthesis